MLSRAALCRKKPDLATAERFVATGGYLWNSGMFVMTAARYLEELQRLRPDILAAVRQAWAERTQDQDFCRLGMTEFDACPSESIDYAVMEHTDRAVVVPADIGWSYVGSWATLWEVADKDSNGNAVRGDVDAYDTHNSYLRAESRLLSVSGLDNVVVVETSDAVIVTTRDKAQSVKDVVSRLDGDKRTEHLNHRRVYRPCGYYESIDDDTNHSVASSAQYQNKWLMVKPGRRYRYSCTIDARNIG